MTEPLSAPSSTPPSDRERRRHPRLAATWPVTLELADGRFEARMRDISESGVCFHVDREVPEMTLMRVGFDLPLEGETCRVEGTGAVVRCIPLSPRVDHYEVAVFFSDLDGPARERLREFVAATAS